MDAGGTDHAATPSRGPLRAVYLYAAGALAVLLLVGAFLVLLLDQSRMLSGSCTGFTAMQLRTITQAQPAARAALAATTATDQAKALRGIGDVATCDEATTGRHDVSPQAAALARQMEQIHPRLAAVAALRDRVAAPGAAPLPVDTLRAALQPVFDADTLVPGLYDQLNEPTMVAYAAYSRLTAVAELLLLLLVAAIGAVVGLIVARRSAPDASAQTGPDGGRVRRPAVLLGATIAACALAVAVTALGDLRLAGWPWTEWPATALQDLCAVGGACVLSLMMCRRSSHAWWVLPLVPTCLSAVDYGQAALGDDSWRAPGSLLLTALLAGPALAPSLAWRRLNPPARPVQAAHPAARWRGAMVAWPLLVVLACWIAPDDGGPGQHVLAYGVVVLIGTSVILADLTRWRRGLLPVAASVLLFTGASTYVVVTLAPAGPQLLWFTTAAVLGVLVPVVDTGWKHLAAGGAVPEPAVVPAAA